MRRHTEAPRGALHRVTIDSEALTGNLLGDPSRRDVDVYLPPGRTDGAGLPLLVDLVGFTGSGLSHTSWKNFGENVPERADRLIAEGRMAPVAIAFPDCFTRLGGNQYIDSAAMGRWEDFLIEEMLPAVEGRFGCGGAGRRGVFGKSSGGYGAMVHAMRHADVWAAAASHSGDVGFELLFGGDFPGHPARARPPRPVDRELHPLDRGAREAQGRGDPRAHGPGHGGDLRSGPVVRSSASACRLTSRPASASRIAGPPGWRGIRSR